MWTCPDCKKLNMGGFCARCGAKKPEGAANVASINPPKTFLQYLPTALSIVCALILLFMPMISIGSSLLKEIGVNSFTPSLNGTANILRTEVMPLVDASYNSELASLLASPGELTMYKAIKTINVLLTVFQVLLWVCICANVAIFFIDKPKFKKALQYGMLFFTIGFFLFLIIGRSSLINQFKSLYPSLSYMDEGIAMIKSMVKVNAFTFILAILCAGASIFISKRYLSVEGTILLSIPNPLWKCSCGAMNPITASFCGKCGAAKSVSTTSGWTCPRCGKAYATPQSSCACGWLASGKSYTTSKPSTVEKDSLFSSPGDL